MSSATMTQVAVSRPPSPHLGNFQRVFDAFAQRQQAADHVVALEPERKPSACEAASPRARETHLVQVERRDAPGLSAASRPTPTPSRKREKTGTLAQRRAAQALDGSPGRRPARVADHVLFPTHVRGSRRRQADSDGAVAYDSPTQSSDTTVNSASTSGSFCQASTALTTPLGSCGMGNGSLALLPDGNASSRGMSLASGGAPSILQATLYAPLAPVDSHAVYGLDDETRRSLDLETPCSPDRSPTRKNVGASPSFQPAFRYREYEAQPFDDVKLYRAVGPHTQYGMTPHYMCSEEDKQKIIVIKMAGLFQMDAQLERTMPVARKPVHIFVDLSNIVIGFYDSLRKIHGIPTAQKMKAPPFSFQNLAMVLERGRRVGKKVVAGSLVNTYNRRWPAYMEEAKGLGYEMNILQRVPKAALSPARNKPRRGTHNGDGGEWTTSGAESSGGEDAACFPLRNGEQGVDEILHLKMLQSALDSEPGTVVLATGDAAEAEYSDGFKKNVERLLQSGWNVEIIGWAQCISSAWKDPGFVEKWGDRVRLIELDMFTEELFAVWF